MFDNLQTRAFSDSPLIRVGDAYVRCAAIVAVTAAAEKTLIVHLTDGRAIVTNGHSLADFEKNVLVGDGKALA